MPRVMLATLLINEMEWLPELVRQHGSWPGLVGWCFVEGADPVYRVANPSMVRADGLSVDGTSEFIDKLVGDRRYSHVKVRDPKIAGDPAQFKCALRNYYLVTADALEPEYVVVLDADEFYTREDQYRINDIADEYLCGRAPQYDSVMLLQRHIWRPPCYRSAPLAQEQPRSLFSQEVIGGYWQVPHTRVWRYVPGMRYVRNHNWPESRGRFLSDEGYILRVDLAPQDGEPQCVHMGFASYQSNRAAKHRYYRDRGEGSEGGSIGRKRQMYVNCRAAWETWTPGTVLPHGARIVPYSGPVPECFQ